jgi:D-alanine--poly(phosphoribitol) ligase subunit 1
VILSTCDLRSEVKGEFDRIATIFDARELLESAYGFEAPSHDVWVTGEETQYIIFTSGSTGRPKGIEVTANDVSHFMDWMDGFPVVRDGGRTFLDQAHYSFDLSEYELVGALSTGGTLHAISDAESKDYPALFADLASSGVEVWVSTPSFADLCLVDHSFDMNLLPDLKIFLFCGEALHHTTVDKLRKRFPGVIVANTYGPTESTVAVTYCEIDDVALADDATLPVGRARLGTELRIIDHETSEVVPLGQTGEIVICGDTVAKGYYENPEKTAEAFFASSMSDGTPMRAYRTGDLGHLDETGMLYCTGRLDSLVKVNGLRIELSEVEGALEEIPCVMQAAVVPVERNGKTQSLCAFVVVDERRARVLVGGEASSEFDLGRALKTELGRTLPAYMVPRRVRVLDDMPLSENGKCDRKALAASLSGRR